MDLSLAVKMDTRKLWECSAQLRYHIPLLYVFKDEKCWEISNTSVNRPFTSGMQFFSPSPAPTHCCLQGVMSARSIQCFYRHLLSLGIQDPGKRKLNHLLEHRDIYFLEVNQAVLPNNDYRPINRLIIITAMVSWHLTLGSSVNIFVKLRVWNGVHYFPTMSKMFSFQSQVHYLNQTEMLLLPWTFPELQQSNSWPLSLWPGYWCTKCNHLACWVL